MIMHKLGLQVVVVIWTLLCAFSGNVPTLGGAHNAISPAAHPFWKLAHLHVSSSPIGLSPGVVCAAYSLPCRGGNGATIAVVDAYDHPHIGGDLETFKRQYGIEGCALTTVNERGGSTLPAPSTLWAMEISLDVEWVCALAPAAHILLVEARTDHLRDLLRAEDYAASHAAYVTNSWGTSEYASERDGDSHFNVTGVSFFASAGDSGLGAQYPSASPYVLSVGGTTLTLMDGNIMQSETGWSSSGGGCSLYEVPNQNQIGQTGDVDCRGKRATPDISFDADPLSGVSIFNSVVSDGSGGWFQIGGTSIGAPAWAAITADTGGVIDAARLYALPATHLRDITSGNNGASCRPGYDLVTGRGSPLGLPKP